MACWDLNGDGVGQPEEDINGDMAFNALDCQGPQGEQGVQGGQGLPGDPGEDGTANVAGETTRQSASFGAASGGSMVTSANVTWTNVSTTETVTHWPAWDAASAGNCLWTGALTSSASLEAGDTFQITSLTLTLD